MSDPQYFTLVFEGDIRSFKANPLKTETPFGIPFAAGIGNAFAENDDLGDRLVEATRRIEEGNDILVKLIEAEAKLERYRKALEVIAGSSDRLQSLQAVAALDNIGPPLPTPPAPGRE